MLSSLDHTATDALHNFQVALRHSQEALQQEEARFNQLTQAIHQQQEVNSTHREFIRGQQQPRLDALHREITRLRSLLDQQREEAGSQQSHLEAVRRPRREGEARDRELRRKIEGQRREYSRRAAAVQAALLQWWNPQNSLENLSAVAEQRVLEAEALRCQVAGLQTRLQDLTATVVGEANQNRNGAGTDSVEKESNTDNVAGKGGEASAEDQCDGEGCVESLRLRLRQQQDQREAFVQSSSENISFRRRELQSLKADLQKLCAAVETADAARQEVQQKLRGALNQQSNTRVVCCRCGLDVVGSFVA